MKVTILGSGSFIESLDHFGPGYLLEVDDKKILIDAGSGITLQLLKKRIRTSDLDYIFVTHLHADHTLELVQLMMTYYIPVRHRGVEKSKTVRIIGPKGIKKFIDNLLTIHNHEKAIDFEGFEIGEFDSKMEFDSFNVTPFPIEHLGLDANSYRFEHDGKSVAFTGDASDCQGVRDLAKNVDLLICDSSNSKERKPDKVHLNTQEIADIATEGNVKKVILSHLLPDGFGKDLVSEVKETFSGEVILANDLMEIKL